MRGKEKRKEEKGHVCIAKLSGEKESEREKRDMGAREGRKSLFFHKFSSPFHYYCRRIIQIQESRNKSRRESSLRPNLFIRTITMLQV